MPERIGEIVNNIETYWEYGWIPAFGAGLLIHQLRQKYLLWKHTPTFHVSSGDDNPESYAKFLHKNETAGMNPEQAKKYKVGFYDPETRVLHSYSIEDGYQTQHRRV